ncbi:MAG: 2,3-bisphosphoglycerate-independent phosphoglycerate mutase [Prolixibacteraceae bacterium]|jgi:2,3-bisphosphoglycerate-independent phosphoglycerate mutase|nr:2,3-bisphosphoglycerate-independent phosphoglycerate mutase [Prolixibacteraceae bacterium]MBT6764103.1 2,3-bisphosphoglycerate-independent phosphoglycerate mutase [Prolixibacteraceae bacterium]MBT7000285.1 2,3-bisphosphoglycerate-independent phosphoglycerate mutase [Prolixibacteraceae bacterium]MBT7394024.1 2,3-bisphosphoglycerate-independent phosphoglycerate mutase [Prolixibacteraceae bacterium]
MDKIQKTLLMILDGWGIGNGTKSDIIATAPTPFIDSLMKDYPHSQLLASGENVGLPDGQMGNSEVGHLSIGAGRVLYQDMVKITKSIRDKSLWENQQIVEAYSYAKENNKKVHLVGLIGPGGVHALSTHMVALCQIATDMGLNDIFVHGLTDGRDTDPRSGHGFLETDLKALESTNARFASIIGRYYGMDRDKNYDRLKLAYDLYTKGKGEKSTDLLATVQASYNNGVTDEFLKPIVMVDEKGSQIGKFENGDVVICFNFRTDRLRQTTIAFTQENLPEFGMHTMDLKWFTLTNYKADFKGINVIFDKENVSNTMGDVISKAGLKQIRIAETEKYAHVTFFFSGGREDEFEGETRILIPSPKVATYDLQPEMSAPKVKEAIVPKLKNGEADFVCLNFANGDMVGHTGVYEAIYKAVVAVDRCVKDVVEAALEGDYNVMIIADHGNADYVINEDGSENTAHSLNPVPCIFINNKKIIQLENGILADVAPTLISVMGLEIPKEMTGKNLIK